MNCVRLYSMFWRWNWKFEQTNQSFIRQYCKYLINMNSKLLSACVIHINNSSENLIYFFFGSQQQHYEELKTFHLYKPPIALQHRHYFRFFIIPRSQISMDTHDLMKNTDKSFHVIWTSFCFRQSINRNRNVI